MAQLHPFLGTVLPSGGTVGKGNPAVGARLQAWAPRPQWGVRCPASVSLPEGGQCLNSKYETPCRGRQKETEKAEKGPLKKAEIV